MPYRRKHHTKTTKKLIRKRCKSRCALCGRFVRHEDASLDHIVALSQGGYDKRKNLQLAHRDCNHRKGRMSMAEWYTLNGGTTGTGRDGAHRDNPDPADPSAPRLRRGCLRPEGKRGKERHPSHMRSA